MGQGFDGYIIGGIYMDSIVAMSLGHRGVYFMSSSKAVSKGAQEIGFNELVSFDFPKGVKYLFRVSK